MSIKHLCIFSIFLLLVCISPAQAQQINIGEKAEQKKVLITIDESGNGNVKHTVYASNTPRQMELIDGTVRNLSIVDEIGNDQIVTVIGKNDAVMISPSANNLIVEYDLMDMLTLKDNFWKMEFLYLESTSFIIPEKLDLIYVNDRPIVLHDKKGFVCHGCQMTLEYSFNEMRVLENVKWEESIFPVEIKTDAVVEEFVFNQAEKSVGFNIEGENKFVTATIPLELLGGPYVVLYNNEKAFFHEIGNNGTHIELNFRPNGSGEIEIIGTTVIPEFPIIAPLVVGFSMILALQFLRKFSLR